MARFIIVKFNGPREHELIPYFAGPDYNKNDTHITQGFLNVLSFMDETYTISIKTSRNKLSTHSLDKCNNDILHHMEQFYLPPFDWIKYNTLSYRCV